MQKPKAILSALFHRQAEHIKVEIQNKLRSRNLLNQIQGRRWSKTHHSWYVPKSSANFQQLKALFEVEIRHNKIVKQFDREGLADVEKKGVSFEKTVPNEYIVIEPEHEYRVKVFIPKHRNDWIEKVKSLPNRAWNQEEKYWSIPKRTEILKEIEQLFGQHLKIAENIEWKPSIAKQFSTEQQLFQQVFSQGRQEEISKKTSRKGHIEIPTEVNIREIYQYGKVTKIVYGDKIVMTKIDEEWIAAFVPSDKKGWIAVMKNMPGRQWNVENRCWCLPYVKETQKTLESQIISDHIIYKFTWSPDVPERFDLPKKQQADIIINLELNEMQKRAILALEEKLILEGKRQRTIKTYKSHLRRFLLFYRHEKPSKITFEQINKYIIVRKKQENVSNSYLSQFINAINAFYIRVLNQEDKVTKLKRPPKQKKLPNVFSEEEVQLLLKSCSNLKHKCLLILTYSGGLRKSEVLQLKVHDLNFDRKTIFIRNSKGGKDRYTFFSDVAIKHLQQYIKQYTPSIWLFEGQFGGNYAESSLQSIFEQAKQRCKVNPFVTLHGLRHSFATHLVEKGVPLSSRTKLCR